MKYLESSETFNPQIAICICNYENMLVSKDSLKVKSGHKHNCSLAYCSNKMRKAQNEHLNIVVKI